MKATRWPALVLIPLLVAALMVADGLVEREMPEIESPIGERAGDPSLPPLATIAPIDAPSASWYCVGGTGGGNGILTRSSLVLTNAAPEVRHAVISVSGEDGALAVGEEVVPALDRLEIELASYSDAANVAVLVEVDGGGTAAALTAEGPFGWDVMPCASEPCPEAHFATATTTLDASATLLLFNPFPDDASLDISVITDEGVRVPGGFDGFPVPRGELAVVHLPDIVTVRDHFAITVEARAGRIVSTVVQSFDGSEGVRGLSLLAAAPGLTESWLFPLGRSGGGIRQTFVVVNPTDTTAEIEVVVSMDDPAVGPVLPIEMSVPRRGFVLLDDEDPLWNPVPDGSGHAVVIQSLNGVRLVVAQVLVFDESADVTGLASSHGIPLGARAWMLATLDNDGASSTAVAVNPSPSTRAPMAWTLFGQGASTDLPAIELSEGEHQRLPLDEFDLAGQALAVASDSPVAVVQLLTVPGVGRALLPGLPVAGTAVRLDPVG